MIELKAGLAFKSKTFTAQAEIVKIDEAAHKIAVRLISSEDHAHIEVWGLDHVKWAFERGDYFIPKNDNNLVTIW